MSSRFGSNLTPDRPSSLHRNRRRQRNRRLRKPLPPCAAPSTGMLKRASPVGRSEQILLGRVGEGTGIAAKVLRSARLNLKDARAEVEKLLRRASSFVPVEIPFTPSAKKVIESLIEESRQLGHGYIGSEHLLLGLIREDNGVAAIILKTFQADPGSICMRFSE